MGEKRAYYIKSSEQESFVQLDLAGESWEHATVMTRSVQKIAAEVKALPEAELDEFLSWLAEYDLARPDRWDKEIEVDSQAGGRLSTVLNRVLADIKAGRTKPLDEVLHDA